MAAEGKCRQINSSAASPGNVVATGFRQVNFAGGPRLQEVLETDVYAESVGYGWQENTIKSYDRASGGDLLRDFHYAPQGTFLVNPPIGGMRSCFRWGTPADCTTICLSSKLPGRHGEHGCRPVRDEDVPNRGERRTADAEDRRPGRHERQLRYQCAGSGRSRPVSTGAEVVEVLPTNLVVASVHRVTLRFSEPIDVNSFDASDVSLVGPTGPVEPLTVTRLSDVTYESASHHAVMRGNISCGSARNLGPRR